jgi:hypothetical protein
MFNILQCWRSVPLASPTLFCNIQHLISPLKEERNKKKEKEEEKKSIRFHISHPAGISHPSSLTLSLSLSFYLRTI